MALPRGKQIGCLEVWTLYKQHTTCHAVPLCAADQSNFLARLMAFKNTRSLQKSRFVVSAKKKKKVSPSISERKGSCQRELGNSLGGDCWCSPHKIAGPPFANATTEDSHLELRAYHGSNINLIDPCTQTSYNASTLAASLTVMFQKKPDTQVVGH